MEETKVTVDIFDTIYAITNSTNTNSEDLPDFTNGLKTLSLRN